MSSTNGSVHVAAETREILEKPMRRRISKAEKLRLLTEADACTAGTQGAFLRRNGLYSSQLYAWRRLRECGELESGAVRKKRAAPNVAALTARNLELEREVHKLRRRIERAELIDEIQKKASRLLGMDHESRGIDDAD
ncbi:MAG: transposase [Candidatus Velthaea sp.]